jgi:DNA polymerase-3 subunit alpha
MPDIDMDFDSRYRDEMIRYATERYGRDKVAQIVTFSTIKARAAVRDAARVLGFPYALGDRVAKAMPPLVMGRDTPLWACLDPDPKYEDGYRAAAELRAMCAADPDVKQVVDVARGIEGLRRQDGIHAAAVVITREPLTDYLPVQRKPETGQAPEEAPVVTQYEMHGVEELGLLKMDFLGLRNLDVITDSVAMIRAGKDPSFDVDAIPLDDDPTLALLRRGDSIGVFQLEGTPMRALMRSLAPTSFVDVAALVALYRPGPMSANMHNDYADRKNGRKPVAYFHQDAAELLSDTWGLMIFQEQVMRVSQKFAGYSLAEADNLRKACGKKIRSLMAQEREKFVTGCATTGYGEPLGDSLFDTIEGFADYAFPKSHSYAYGLIAYQTAYLKVHYPVEYFACLLTSVKSNLDKAAIYLAECRNLDVKVLNPDVNVSESDFVALDTDDPRIVVDLPPGCPGVIPFGLSAVRNVGEGLVELILAERRANGPFTDFYDFVERVDPTVLNKRSIESLIKAGAFDAMGHRRRGLLVEFERIIDTTMQRRRERDQGVMSLFADIAGDSAFDERIAIPDIEFDKTPRLRFEKEMLGLYVSDHPLMGVEWALRRKVDCSVAEAAEREDGSVVILGGVVTGLTRKFTKRGDPMAVFQLEDLESSIEVTVFPKTMLEQGHKLVDDVVITVRGRIDARDETAKLMCSDITVLEAMGTVPELRLRVPAVTLSDERIDHLKRLLLEHPGESPVVLDLGDNRLRLPDDYRVDLTGVIGELRVAFGHDAVAL